MRSSAFNRQITIQKKQVTLDPNFGTEIITWVPLALISTNPDVAERFPAEVIDLAPSRSEGVLHSDLALARNLTRVRIRWRTDVDSTMRVILHGDVDRTMEIIGGPSEYGGRMYGLELMCEALTS